jgi:hypothetical protein
LPATAAFAARVPGGAAEQTKNGVSGAVIGGSLGGLAALAALLLLLLLRKKKKQEEVEEGEETVGSESTLGTIDGEDEYISEYGLSDGVRPLDSDQDVNDLPNDELDSNFIDECSNASEHNPEELDDGALDPDES